MPFLRRKILSILIILFLSFQFLYIQTSSNPLEPPVYPYIFIWTGESLYLPNEIVREFTKITDDDSFILISTNYTLEKLFVRKLSYNCNISWEIILNNTSFTRYYIDNNIGGLSAVILLVEDTVDENRKLVIIDMRTGELSAYIELEGLIGNYVNNYRDYYYENSVYIADKDLLIFVFHPFYDTLNAVAVNLSSMNITWTVKVPYVESISIPRIWDDQLVFSLIRGTPLTGYNLTLLSIELANGNFSESEILNETQIYAQAEPSPSPGNIIIRYSMDGHNHIMFVNTSTGLQRTVNLSSLDISYLESYKLYWDSTGEKFAIIGYNQSVGNDTLLVFSKNGDLVDSITVDGYIYVDTLTWSPNGEEILFDYSPQRSIYDKLMVYNLSTRSSILARDIPIITTSTWSPTGERLYIGISPYTGPPVILVYKHNDAGYYVIESKTIVFHPYNVKKLIIDEANDTIHVFFLDNVHYDNQYGYWDRIFLYHLVQVPVHVLSRLDDNSYLVGAYAPRYSFAAYTGSQDIEIDGTVANIFIDVKAIYPIYVWKTIYNENSHEWDITSIYYGTLLFIESSSTLNTDSVSVPADIYINISLNTSYRGLETLYKNKTGVSISLYENNGILTLQYSYTPHIVARYKAINTTIIFPILYSDNPQPVSPEDLLEININQVIYSEGNTETATTTTPETTTTTTTQTTTESEQATVTTQSTTTQSEQSSTTQTEITGENTETAPIQENKENTLMIGILLAIVVAIVIIWFVVKK